MSIKGSITEKNLLKSFLGESQAKNRYLFYAKQAKKDGFEQIAEIFEKTALQEENHAKTFFRYLEGGLVEITSSFYAGTISSTSENLLLAANGEKEEWSTLYPKYSELAEKEGFKKISNSFRLIAEIEKSHEERFMKLYHNIINNIVFKKDKPVFWVCRKCGYIHYGEKALLMCPACEHPQAYFELKTENF